MIKIYRIREDGSLKDFYCKTQSEADEKLKLPNFTDKEVKKVEKEPDLFIEDVKPEEIPEFIDEEV